MSSSVLLNINIQTIFQTNYPKKERADPYYPSCFFIYHYKTRMSRVDSKVRTGFLVLFKRLSGKTYIIIKIYYSCLQESFQVIKTVKSKFFGCNSLLVECKTVNMTCMIMSGSISVSKSTHQTENLYNPTPTPRIANLSRKVHRTNTD